MQKLYRIKTWLPGEEVTSFRGGLHLSERHFVGVDTHHSPGVLDIPGQALDGIVDRPSFGKRHTQFD